MAEQSSGLLFFEALGAEARGFYEDQVRVQNHTRTLFFAPCSSSAGGVDG